MENKIFVPFARNKMTQQEKLETVEELSVTVTNHLSLREQLEVIRIINPLADTSTTESEFFIGTTIFSIYMILIWKSGKFERLSGLREQLRGHSNNNLTRAHFENRVRIFYRLNH